MFSKEIQYSVVRYMLNELGDEAANVALVALTNEDPPRLIARALPDPTVKSRTDRKVQRDVVARFLEYIASIDVPNGSPLTADQVFGQLKERSGGLVRITNPRCVLTADVERDISLLYEQLVGLPSELNSLTELVSAPSVKRRDPLGGLRDEANKAIVRAFRTGYGHPLRKDSYKRSYVIEGAKHKSTFDLAYFVGTGRKKHEHVFQHVLVMPDAQQTFNQAAGLCVRWADIRAANGADRELSAVLYSRPKMGRMAGTSEATRLLEEADIEVVPLKKLPDVAHKLAEQMELDIEANQ